MRRPLQVLEQRIQSPRFSLGAAAGRFFRPVGLRALLVGAALGFGLGHSQAGPKGEKVVRGSVSFDRDGSVTNIRASDGAIINYKSFDLGKGEKVQFFQPGSSSRVLNRIGGDNPTNIFGTIQANGIVYLVNPSGIYFRDGSMVNVNGIFAAAGHLSDADFISGRNNFTGLGGDVFNSGNISALGDVHLLGANVANFGSVTSQSGTVMLVAGSDVLIGERDSNVYVTANPKATVPGNAATPGVENRGTITAQRAIMGAGDMYSVAISNSGLVKARDIQLQGGATGIVNVSGTLDASSQKPGETGGSVKIEGDKIALRAATVDASGPAGGGSVNIGGEYQGGGTMRHASQTIVDAASTIKADATVAGHGGNVVVWSDHVTQYYGTISAKGGTISGNGGNAEISGKEALIAKGAVDLTAVNGQLGTLLYDPGTIRLEAGNGDGSDSPDSSATSVKGNATNGTVDFLDVGSPAVGDFVVTEQELEATSATANIVLKATNSIYATDTFTLNIQGGHDITMETSSTGGAGINLGTVTLQMTGGKVTLTSGSGIGVGTAPIVVGSIASAGLITINSRGSITQTAGGLIDGFGVSLTAGTTIGTAANAINFSGLTITTVSNGDQYLRTPTSTTISSLDANAGTIALTGGTFNLTASDRIDNSSSINVNGATFNLGTSNETVAGVALNAGSITGTTGVLTSTTNFQMQQGSVSAILGGAVGLNKNTAGLVTLSGANTYNGTTSINSGELDLNRIGGASIAGNVSITGGTIKLLADNQISDTSNVSLNGAGTLDINSHSDTVNGVLLNQGSITGTTGTLTSSTTFDMQAGLVTAKLGGTQGLTKSSAQTVVLSGANTYTGLTKVTGGTLALGADNVLADGSTVELATNGVLSMGVFNDTISSLTLTQGTIAGTGTLTASTGFQLLSGDINAHIATTVGAIKTSSGTVTLNSANNAIHNLAVQDGTFLLKINDALAAGTTVSVNVLTGGGTARFDLNNFNQTIGGLTLFAPSTAGSTSVTLGNGKLTLGGNVTVSATAGVAEGNVVITGTGGATLDLGGGVRQFNVQGRTAAHDLDLDVPVVNGTMVINATNDGGGGLGTVAFNAANGSALPITVQVAEGKLITTVNNAFATQTNLILGTNGMGIAGQVDLLDFNATIASLSTATGNTGGINNIVTNSVGNSTLTISAASGSSTFAGLISGSIVLRKDGASTLNLTGSNTFTGGTQVLGGVLGLGAVANALSGDILINGGTLLLLANDQIADTSTVTVQSGTLNVDDFSDLIGGLILRGGTVSGDAGVLSSSTNFDLRSGTIAGNLGGATGADKTTGGTVTVTHLVSYAGPTTISDGTLALGANNVLSDSGTVVITTNGTLALGTFNDTVSGVTLNGGTIDGPALTSGTLTSTTAFQLLSGTINGHIASAAGAIKSTSGTVSLNSAGNALGTLAVENGTFRLGINNALASSTNVSVNQPLGDGVAKFDLNNFNQTVGGLTLYAPMVGGSTTVALGSGTLTLGGDVSVSYLPGVAEGEVVITGTTGTLNLGGAVRQFNVQGRSAASDLTLNVPVVNGTMVINATNDAAGGLGTVTFNAVNNSSQPITVQVAEGQLVTTVAGALAAQTNLVLGRNNSAVSGQLDLRGTNQTVASLGLGSSNSGGTDNKITTTTGNSIFTVSNTTGSSSFGGQITGAVTLRKNGASTLILTGSNNQTGGTEVLGGVLALSAAADALSGNILINGGTLRLLADNQIADTSTVTAQLGTLDIGDFRDLVGGLILNGGTVQGDAGILSSSTNFDLRSGTINGNLGGSSGADKTTAGTVIVNHETSYDGTTTISAGTLALTADKTLGSSAGGTIVNTGGALDLRNVAFNAAEAITLNGGAFGASTGTSVFNGTIQLAVSSKIDVSGTQLTLGGPIVVEPTALGAGIVAGITKTGAGTLLLTTTSVYNGQTIIEGGLLKLGISNALPIGTTLITTANGSLELNGFSQEVAGLGSRGTPAGGINNSGSAATFTVNNPLTSPASTYNGVISGAINLVKRNDGLLILGGASTYTGTTNIVQGTIRLAGGANRLPVTTKVTLGDTASNSVGILDLFGQNQELAGLTALGTGTSAVINSLGTAPNATLTFNIASGISDFSGNLGNNAGGDAFIVNKIGLGILTLSGNNSYTGLTTVTQGILRIASNKALGSSLPGSGTVVTPGGTLQISGGITFAEELTLSGIGAAGTSGALENFGGVNTLTGAVTLPADARIGVDAGTTLFFQGTMNGPGGLTLAIGAGGGAALSGTVGGTTPLASFSSTGAGTLGLASVMTVAGAVNIATPTILLGNATINSTAGIEFTSAALIDSSSPTQVLTLNADTDNTNDDGNIIIGAAVGSLLRPGSITFGASTDTIFLNNPVFNTALGVNFNAPVTLGADVLISTTTGTAAFAETVTGAGHALTVQRDAEFHGNVAGVTNLLVGGTTLIDTATIETTGSQHYIGAVTLGGDTTLTATNSPINFDSTIDGAHSLKVDAMTGGTVTFSGAVGGLTPLTGLTAFGNVVNIGAVTTDGPIWLASQNAMNLNGAINAGAGTIKIEVNQDGLGNESFVQTAVASLTTTNDTADALTINVGGTGNAVLGQLAVSSNNARVTVTAQGGSIIDNNGAIANIVGAEAVLVAGNGVGTAADAIETSIKRVEGDGGTGGFYLDNGTTALTVGGVTPDLNGLKANGDIILHSGDLALTEDLVSLSSVQLFSTGAVTQTSGKIDAPKLGVQADSATFSGINNVGEIAAKITGAGNPFIFSVDSTLTIGSVGVLSGVQTNGGDVTITSVNGSLILKNDITAPGGNVLLSAAAGSITETTGLVRAGSLETHSATGTLLGSANAIGIFTAENTVSGDILLKNTVPLSIAGITQGGGNVDITNSAAMTVDGPVEAGGGFIHLTTTSGNLILNANVSNGAGGMVLTGASGLLQNSGTIKSTGLVELIATSGPITQAATAGITATEVHTKSTAGTSLLGINAIAKFDGTNTGAGDLVLKNTGDLEILNIAQSGGNVIVTGTGQITTTGPVISSGGVSLTSTGTATDVVINGPLEAGGIVELISKRNVIVATPVKSEGANLKGQIVELRDDFLAGSGDFKIQADVAIYLEGLNYSGRNIYWNFDPLPVLPTGRRATIVATNPGLTTVTAKNIFAVGYLQKFLSFGSLTIEASDVTIGDLAARYNLIVDAGSITLLDREATGVSSGGAVDRGLNIVADSITFSGKMSFAGTGNGIANFAATAAPNVPRIAGTTLYRDVNLASRFSAFTGLPSGGFNNGVPALTTFPPMPIAGGIVDSQVVAVLASIMPEQRAPEGATEDKISAATAAKLLSLGVNARDPDEEEKKDLLRKRALFKQLVAKQGASDSEYKVVVNRITSTQVVAVLKKYDEIFGPNQEGKSAIEDLFRQVYARYVEETAAVDTSGFGSYLVEQGPKNSQAAEALRVIGQFRELFAEVGRLGLTPKEMKISEGVLARSLTVEGLTSNDFLALVGAGPAIKPPADGAAGAQVMQNVVAPTPAAPDFTPAPQVLPPARPLPQPATIPVRDAPPEYFREELPELPPISAGAPLLGASAQP